MTTKQDDTELLEALDICTQWFKYLERQKKDTETLQKAASLARKGDKIGAQILKSQVDSQPRVFDGGYLLPAVRTLVAFAKDRTRVKAPVTSEGVEIVKGTGNKATRPLIKDAVDEDGNPVKIVAKWWWDEMVAIAIGDTLSDNIVIPRDVFDGLRKEYETSYENNRVIGWNACLDEIRRLSK